VHNLAGKERDRIASSTAIGAGAHSLAFRFEKTAEYAGRGTLLVDGEEVGRGDIPFFTPVRFSITGSGLSVGYELGPAISDDYVAPFPFNAVVHRVVVDVRGTAPRNVEAEYEAIMSEQ
jgi:arylsulfatase